MEIDALDWRGMAETPQFLHFRNPQTGDPLYSGDEPIGALIRGLQSRSVQTYLAANSRAILARMASDEPSDKTKKPSAPAPLSTPAGLQKDAVITAALLTVEIKGVVSDGKPLAPDQFERFYDLNFIDLDVALARNAEKRGGQSLQLSRPGSFSQQALWFSEEIANFFTNA